MYKVKSEPITVVHQRALLEYTNNLKGFITEEEFQQIMNIYLSAVERMEKEEME